MTDNDVSILVTQCILTDYDVNIIRQVNNQRFIKVQCPSETKDNHYNTLFEIIVTLNVKIWSYCTCRIGFLFFIFCVLKMRTSKRSYNLRGISLYNVVNGGNNTALALLKERGD